ncbi:phosphotransferase family protein [Sphingosinithalassobacter portus]|uniref:phosphotransferase family protein n=1 Tax=Stakelama portus TaxID=2676234 RepID=UPI000D6E9049|nr:phosphotransferase family protein [Sphingosinithalassobacter portus]
MAEWQSSVDLARLADWMDARQLGSGPIEEVAPLGGGTQNILLRFRRSGSLYVLRRPPAHPRPESNETMRREARVLAALAGSSVPHPRLIAACGDVAAIGTAFYLMEPIAGINAAETLPPFHRTPAVQHRMGLAMVEAIAALGSIDPQTVGLSDFGRAEGYLARQPGRWRRQLESYAAFENWPGPDALPGIDRIGDWLAANCPDATAPGILHGDYHIGNVLFRPDQPELAAIVDWELSTIGDPLVDLGWMVATWQGEDGTSAIVAVDPWTGFPKTTELIEHYRRHSNRDLAAIDWYIVLACYKLGIILEGTFARAAAGLADRETGESLHNSTIRLLERALSRIES